ncbi:MAG: ankyrin repeat domain-containing protein [Akkermansia sp.]|nr:ankyrin repeat domain-containing protein [Akkermansia sp.]
MRLLLSAPGIDVNLENQQSYTALLCAAANGHTKCERLLLNIPEIDVNLAHDEGFTPLCLAAFEGRTECVYVSA